MALPLLAILCVVATFDIWAEIARIAWMDEEHSHIFLAPLVAAWLVWVRRGRIQQCRPRLMWIGPIIVMAGWALLTYGYQFGIATFWYGGAVVALFGCVWSVVGVEVVAKFAPAFGVLVFMIPIPAIVRQPLAMELQRATAQATQMFLEIGGITVERSVNLLTINGTEVAIAEACNGMRMVFALILVSYAFAFGSPLRGPVRVLILLLSPLSALVCNVIRLIPLVWLHGYGTPATTEKFHEISAYVMVLVAYLLLLGVLRLMNWAMVPVKYFNLATD